MNKIINFKFLIYYDIGIIMNLYISRLQKNLNKIISNFQKYLLCYISCDNSKLMIVYK